MKYVIDFYKELDTINLILFWGIVFVTLLLLIFSTIIVRKNRKLKKIIISKEQELEDSRNELAIKTEHINFIQNNIEESKKEIPITKDNYQNKTINITQEKNDNEDIPLIKQNNYQININESPKEKEFKAEELVIDYNKQTPILEKIEKKEEINKEEIKKNITIPTGPYQKNVLRDMSLNQTSPIGIVKRENNYIQELNKAKELNESLKNIEVKNDNYENNYEKEMNHSKEMISKIYDNNQQTDSVDTKNNNNYLNEVSKKLSEATEIDGIKRTEYEIKQEEEAIISYDELMQKKDQIKIVDEEDAVISIDELYKRNNQKERLYNITKEEEDNKFISELKDFRSDL